MRQLKIIRRESNPTETVGELRLDGEYQCATLEPPWRDNLPGESCIPPGVYRAVRFESPTYGPTFKLVNVPNRRDIEIHWGNWATDTDGCILPGEQSGWLDGRRAVLRSRVAFAALIALLEPETKIVVEIVDSTGKEQPNAPDRDTDARGQLGDQQPRRRGGNRGGSWRRHHTADADLQAGLQARPADRPDHQSEGWPGELV